MNGLKLGLILFALLVVVTVFGWDDIEWVFYSGVLLLTVAFIWSQMSLVGISVERTIEADRVFAGNDVRERFQIMNRSRIPKTWMEFHDRSTLPGHSPSREVTVRGHAETRWTKVTRAERRGRYRLGPVEIRAGDPFGLFSRRRSLELSHEVLVYPGIVPLPERSADEGERSGNTQRGRGRVATSPIIRSLRQYAVGDPWNQIAWKASARHGSLMVKELDPDPVTDEWVLLDLSSSQQRRHRAAIEYAVSLTASFCLEWIDAGRDVGLLVNRAMPAVVDAEAGDRQRLKILETLAVVEPYGEANPGTLIGRFASRFSRSTGLVVISTGDGSGFIEPLQHLMRRAVPLTVIAVGDRHEQDQQSCWSEVLAAGIPVMMLASTGDEYRQPDTLTLASTQSAS